MAIVKRDTDYALRALKRLACEQGVVPVSALAEKEAVPEKFLRKIMQKLQQAGIVESRQGPFGGYVLSLPASQVTLRGVMDVVQGPLVFNECFANPGICDRVADCPLRRRMEGLQTQLSDMLSEVRLSDIVQEISTHEDALR